MTEFLIKYIFGTLSDGELKNSYMVISLYILCLVYLVVSWGRWWIGYMTDSYHTHGYMTDSRYTHYDKVRTWAEEEDIITPFDLFDEKIDIEMLKIRNPLVSLYCAVLLLTFTVMINVILVAASLSLIAMWSVISISIMLAVTLIIRKRHVRMNDVEEKLRS